MNSNIVLSGKYYWELMFSYDNSENVGTILHKFKITKKRVISTKYVLNKVLNVKNNYRFGHKSSTSISLSKVVDVNGSVDFSIHREVSKELSVKVETGEELVEETIIEQVYEIGPKSKLKLYRLCYEMDGVIVKTDIVSSSPMEDAYVELHFDMSNRILGLQEILEHLSTIRPREDNKLEWKAIRDSIIRHSDDSMETQFRSLLEILSGTTPGHDNKVEWGEIRRTCLEIIEEWDDGEKQLFLVKLLRRFESIFPGRDNKEEWASIRSESRRIREAIVVVL